MSRCPGSLSVCPVSAWPLKAPQALAEALKVNKTVQKINLSHNIKIGDAGVKAEGSNVKICWA